MLNIIIGIFIGAYLGGMVYTFKKYSPAIMNTPEIRNKRMTKLLATVAWPYMPYTWELKERKISRRKKITFLVIKN